MRGVSRESLALARERLRAVTEGLTQQQLLQLGDELFAVVHLLDEQTRLRRMVSDPAVPAEHRPKPLVALLGQRLSQVAMSTVEALSGASWSRPQDLVDAAEDLAVQALFTAAEQGDALDDVEDELFRFGRTLAREPRLRGALTDPSLPVDRRADLLDGLLTGKVSPATPSLLREAVLAPRGRTVDRALEHYGRLAAERRERLVARVSTVVPLSDQQERRLADALAAHLGHSVHVNVEVVPTLVGGLTVHVGDQLFDGSVVHRLAEARRVMGG